MQTHNSSYFLDKNIFGDDGFRNMFAYQPILDMFELKRDIGTYYVFSCKSKGVYTSKLKPPYIVFQKSITLSGYRIGIKFDKNPLAVEQNNYAT